jgi:hypothetical protein
MARDLWDTLYIFHFVICWLLFLNLLQEAQSRHQQTLATERYWLPISRESGKYLWALFTPCTSPPPPPSHCELFPTELTWAQNKAASCDCELSLSLTCPSSSSVFTSVQYILNRESKEISSLRPLINSLILHALACLKLSNMYRTLLNVYLKRPMQDGCNLSPRSHIFLLHTWNREPAVVYQLLAVSNELWDYMKTSYFSPSVFNVTSAQVLYDHVTLCRAPFNALCRLPPTTWGTRR